MSDHDSRQPAVDVLRECFGRVHDELPSLLEGLTPDQVLWRPGPDANPIGWLVWHLLRVQDDHLAGVAAGLGRPVEQVWPQHEGRFGLPYDTATVGYGQSSEDVAAFAVGDVAPLLDYAQAVAGLTDGVLGGMSDADLARQVDTFDGEAITAQVRLVSVVGDITQHLGQAAYVRGLAEAARRGVSRAGR